MLQKLKHDESNWVSPEASRAPSLSSLCNQKDYRLVLVLVVLIALGHYTACSSFHIYEPEIIGFRVLTGRQSIRSESQKLPVRAIKDREEDFLCDRSHHRTDVCQMKGDVRVKGQIFSVLLYSPEYEGIETEEKIRPYTRKWEDSVMETIDEVSLRRVGNSSEESIPRCDVQHSVPAILFSTGGYTGNVYHEFNDGLIPLFISSQHFKGEVVFLILEYHNWWMTKYGEIVRQLTNYEVLDIAKDKRVHCFPEITVGLRIHDELAIDSNLMKEAASMKDFQKMMGRAFLPRLEEPTNEASKQFGGLERVKGRRSSRRETMSLASKRPKLVILARKGPRTLLNQREVINVAKQIGFNVVVLAPNRRMEMVELYRILNSCDVMIGVHGAAMTHLLFMRPGSTFIQVVPLGTDWAARTYYGEPAVKLGLDYVEYKITPRESSLSDKYPIDDPVLTDPDSINNKGWWETKRVYLEGQAVRLSVARFRKTLKDAYKRAMKSSSARSTAKDLPPHRYEGLLNEA